MSDFYTLLTNAGLAAVANAALTGTSVDITHMAVGDGEGLPVQSRTTLRNEVWRGELTRLAQSAADNTVLECETRIPPDEGGWTVREVGLFNEDGTLLAIGNLPDSYKPVLESGSAKDMQIRMYVQHTNAGTVTLKIDPAIVKASQAWVQDLLIERDLNIISAQVLSMTNYAQGQLYEQANKRTDAALAELTSKFAHLSHQQNITAERASRAVLS